MQPNSGLDEGKGLEELVAYDHTHQILGRSTV